MNLRFDGLNMEGGTLHADAALPTDETMRRLAVSQGDQATKALRTPLYASTNKTTTRGSATQGSRESSAQGKKILSCRVQSLAMWICNETYVAYLYCQFTRGSGAEVNAPQVHYNRDKAAGMFAITLAADSMNGCNKCRTRSRN